MYDNHASARANELDRWHGMHRFSHSYSERGYLAPSCRVPTQSYEERNEVSIKTLSFVRSFVRAFIIFRSSFCGLCPTFRPLRGTFPRLVRHSSFIFLCLGQLAVCLVFFISRTLEAYIIHYHALEFPLHALLYCSGKCIDRCSRVCLAICVSARFYSFQEYPSCGDSLIPA